MKTSFKMPVLLFFLLSTLLLTEITAIGECDSQPCMNGAFCSDQYADTYTCECIGDFQGVNCEVPFDAQLCPFGNVYDYVATVVTGDLPNRYSCQANFRFQGATVVNFTFVMHDIQPSLDGFYLEAGSTTNYSVGLRSYDSSILLTQQSTITFEDSGSNYWIEIFTDRTIISTGFTLEISADRDDCYSTPCMNGATCIDLIRDYECICAPGNDSLNCQEGIVIVDSTNVSVFNGVYEGSFTPAVIFDVTFAPSSLATYSVGGAGTSQLWTVDAFFTSDPTGRIKTSNRRITLNTAQETTLWQPPASTTISGLNALQVQVPGGVVCSDMEYFCAIIGRNTRSSPAFQLTARDDPVSFLGCVSINCRGVEITGTQVSITSGDIREGVSQSVILDVTLNSNAAAGSVSGSDLWQITPFLSSTSDASGNVLNLPNAMLTTSQGNTPLIAGSPTTISGVSIPVDLTRGPTCAQLPGFSGCVSVDRNSLANPQFLLSGIRGPESLSSCQAITCRGVEVTGTSLQVISGDELVEGDSAHQITFDILVNSNVAGGSVSGTNLWKMRAYATGSSTSGGSVINPVDVPLTTSQSDTGINAGTRANITGVTADLNLEGTLCTALAGICVVLQQNPSSILSFTFEPQPDSNVLTSCVPATCTGVQVTNINFNLISGGPLQAGSDSNAIALDLNILTDGDGAGVSGSSLWQLELFLNSQIDGQGRTTLSQLTSIPALENSQSLTAGLSYTLEDVATTLNLRNMDCANLPFVCVRLSKNPGSTPDFTLSEVSPASLVSCQRIPCTDINECASRPCQNGGTCAEGVDSFTCTCAPGYTGTFCTEDINECDSGPCMSGGICNNLIATYTCDCQPGYDGVNCEIDINECASTPCQNGGVCSDRINEYLCDCVTGYAGNNCQDGVFCKMTSQNTVYGNATLERSSVGSVLNSSAACPFNTTRAGEPILTGHCNEEEFGYFWTIAVNCGELREAVKLLEDILEEGITDENLKESAYRTAIVTKHSDEFTAYEANLVADILDRIVWWNSSDHNVTTSFVHVINNIMNMNEEELFDAQEQSNSPSRLVQGLEKQLSYLEVTSSRGYDEKFDNIAVKVQRISSTDASDGIVIRLSGLDITNFTETNTTVAVRDSSSIIAIETTLVQTVIPVEALRLPFEDGNISMTESAKIIFMVYASDVLYPSKYIRSVNQNNSIFSRVVNTPVMTVIVDGRKIEDLSQRVNLTFSNVMDAYYDPVCTFWDTGIGNWSTRGCKLIRVGPDTSFTHITAPEDVEITSINSVTCACDHFTSFAVIVDIYSEGRKNKVFRWLSVIGCGVSIISLIITIFTYLGLICRKTRGPKSAMPQPESASSPESRPVYIAEKSSPWVKIIERYIHLCFCVTLLGLYFAFLAIVGFDAEFRVTELEIIPCSVIAALTHFFALSSLTWMGIEGFHIYLITIRSRPKDEIPKFMLKATLLGWGVPAAIVGATAGLLRRDYALQDFCYVQQQALIGGILVPMGVILLINTIIFIRVICQFRQSASFPGRIWNGSEAQRKECIERTQVGVSFLVLMGLTWSTGYLVLLQDEAAEVPFIIFNSLQGLFIFVATCLRKDDMWKIWKQLCCAAESETTSPR